MRNVAQLILTVNWGMRSVAQLILTVTGEWALGLKNMLNGKPSYDTRI